MGIGFSYLYDRPLYTYKQSSWGKRKGRQCMQIQMWEQRKVVGKKVAVHWVDQAQTNARHPNKPPLPFFSARGETELGFTWDLCGNSSLTSSVSIMKPDQPSFSFSYKRNEWTNEQTSWDELVQDRTHWRPTPILLVKNQEVCPLDTNWPLKELFFRLGTFLSLF